MTKNKNDKFSHHIFQLQNFQLQLVSRLHNLFTANAAKLQQYSVPLATNFQQVNAHLKDARVLAKPCHLGVGDLPAFGAASYSMLEYRCACL